MPVTGTVPTEVPGNYEIYGLIAAGLAANRPAPGVVDRFYFSTDTLVLERDTGIAWVEVVRGEPAIRLAQLAERAHTSLTGIGASDHHVKTVAGDLNLADLAEKAHGSLTGVTANQHHTKYTNGEAVAAAEAAGLALASGKNIKLISALTTNNTWSGLTAIFTAGEILGIGYVAYLKAADSRAWKALATATTTMPGIALATCTTSPVGNNFEYLLRGFLRFDTWTWTPGGLLYVDRTTPGTLTQTAPSTTGDQVQVVGVAITADIILFNPSYELVEIS
ncbi:hypothetical protein ES706_05171 [subsurface metagenome]